MNDAVIGGLIDRVNYLSQVHQVMLSTLVRLVKPVLNNERETSTDKSVRAVRSAVT